ncbi:gliding motility-associated lipoprotein GldD [Larkinella arboricola]|uniref:Gliding motility-associated lipoprotein GldD n=1 Tax=Larkinella arboricola TaxID=643671 RepID=A0A327X722_LARAB|nr:gliding motility lipoprotein GldD [Larkinella arboricola]RAK02531.1 gliding motility-associated lipoprotein GldD [Larkinella arboricola]
MTKFLFVLSAVLLAACGGRNADNYVPKPKGYNRIDLPPHRYQPLTEAHPYTFEYSREARILPDTFRGAQPHWIFVHYPEFKASVQLTYHSVQNSEKRLAGMIADSYKLAAMHNEKAYAFKEEVIQLPSGLKADVLSITGEVPSQLQFFTTDTTTHFLRGALYFNTATRNDSLAPVIDYVRKDVLHLLKTLRWK